MASWDHYRNMSHRLSRLMDDIGVSEEGVMSRRRRCLIEENLYNLHDYLLHNRNTMYMFGSQTEGTTTDGLNSDVDLLNVVESCNLIQNLDEYDWDPDKTNLLMIQDEAFTGYCKLQLLKRDRPSPEVALPSDKLYKFDEAGRVILNHFFRDGIERHGPAEQVDTNKGSQPNDFVHSIRCKTWPNGYKMWSKHPRTGTWPTPEMISYMEKSGCFVVQVAHRLDEKKNESWRISTSLAERCLMFSLNITQIRCYILIKMIVKTFIDPVKPEVISSYICKNLLFHCVENTRSDFWQESNLLRCVNQILLHMLVAVLCMNCPSYFNESINLFLGKVNKDNQAVLMGVIWKVLVSEGGFLADISFDNINKLIHNYGETIYKRNGCSWVEKRKIKFENEIGFYGYLAYTIRFLMLNEKVDQRDLESLQNTMLPFALQGPLQYVSATLLFPFLCSHLATLKSNEHILNGEMISEQTSLLFELSLDSDLTSSRLKFASYFYCTAQFLEVISVLDELGRCFADSFFLICHCDALKIVKCINRGQSLSTHCLLASNVSMCVMFSKAEMRCCPRELQYEMYRSTEQEKLQRDMDEDWMDLACIDSTSYFLFLSYMTLRQLGYRDLRLLALEKLKKYTRDELDHRETVYNLLGQCYEYENRLDEAFACYCKSLRLRPTNNAARWHIVLLLHTVYQNE